MPKSKLLAAALATLLLGGCAASAPADQRAAEQAESDRSTVIVLLVDGLSGKMIEANATKTFHRLQAEGAWTHELLPTFPTVSGPTWVSLSTGCWPSRHGVVTDKFIDPKLGVMDHDGDADWRTGCELLQETAERQHVRTAALGWWGQHSRTRGKTATFVSGNIEAERAIPRDALKFTPDRQRIEEIVRYLKMPPDERPRLILGYLPGPDHDVHWSGETSTKAVTSILATDQAVGDLIAAIEALPNKDRVTLLIASDHGHVPVTHVINLNFIMLSEGIEGDVVSTGSTAFVYLKDKARLAAAHAALSKHREFDVFTRDDQPGYAHLGTSGRVGDLIVSAHTGYFVADPDLWPEETRGMTKTGPALIPSPYQGFGIYSAHGYAPETPGVQGVLYAWGSGVAGGRKIGKVQMIDVHPTVTQLLGISPGRPVDGRPITNVFAKP